MIPHHTTTIFRMTVVSRAALVAAAMCAAQLASAQTPPPSGVGIYLDNALLTSGYAGNGSADYATGPGISIYSSGGTQITAASTSNFRLTSQPLALGMTAGTLSSTGSGATVSSTADLSAGVLRVAAGAAGSARGIAGAQIKDNLSFQVLAGGSSTITVTAHLDGSFLPILGGNFGLSQSMGLGFGQGSFDELGGRSNPTSPYYFGHSGASGNTPPSGWLSYSFSNESASGFDFVGTLAVTDGQRMGLNFHLSTDCTSAVCDFGNTGRVGLILPDNVTFTSDSGVFLTAGALPVAAIPEPETWGLMLGGLAFVGGFARRRIQG